MCMPSFKKKGILKLNTIIYLFMFAMGVVLGSFYTLAVYRIPLKQDITHTRSYCPKCNHTLDFFDLIPVLSYIFLRGKCRYCKEKIRPRYLIIELASGLVFTLFAVILKIDILNIEIEKILILVFGVFFLSTLFIQVGIFNEYKKINKSVFNFGIAISLIYMIYLCILKTSIYRHIICIILLLIMLIINNLRKRKELLATIGFVIFALLGIIEICISII